MRNQDPNRPFPIQGGWDRENHKEIKPFKIPWWLAEIAYDDYSRQYGTDQSLERMYERGGFGPWELVTHIRNSKITPNY